MFFYLSKIFWALAAPSNFLFLITVIIIVMVLRRPLNIVCRRAAYTLCVAYLVLLILPIGDWLLAPWEQQYKNPPELSQVNGIIILGGAINPTLSEENNNTTFGSAAERITSLLSLSKKYPQVEIIFSGGSGNIQQPDRREADYAKKIYEIWGIKNITYERESRNTYENAVFSKKLLQPKDNETWLLVTSAAHMPRSQAIFKRQSWHTIPYPVDYKARQSPVLFCFCAGDNLDKMDRLAHEVLGLLIYKMAGKA